MIPVAGDDGAVSDKTGMLEAAGDRCDETRTPEAAGDGTGIHEAAGGGCSTKDNLTAIQQVMDCNVIVVFA